MVEAACLAVARGAKAGPVRTKGHQSGPDDGLEDLSVISALPSSGGPDNRHHDRAARNNLGHHDDGGGNEQHVHVITPVERPGRQMETIH